MTKEPEEMTFWDHLDILRGTLIKGLLLILVCSVVIFLFKDPMFQILLAPQKADFITYELFKKIGETISFEGNIDDETFTNSFSIQLVNTELASQFIIHVKISIYIAFMLTSPILFYLIFKFISPALYKQEKKIALKITISALIMFSIGILVNYFLIFPFTFRFLGTYQVSGEVENLITLNSYITTLLTMTFLLGILFELPVVCWILGRFGILNASLMRQYMRHAIIAILIISAIITPTADAFTLLLTACPICLLYGLSIWVVPKSHKKQSISESHTS